MGNDIGLGTVTDCRLQGSSWQTVYFDLGLSDSNIKVRLISKVDLES